MQMDVYDGRIYLPAEDPKKPHERNVVHPETNVSQVLMGDEEGTNLGEYLGPQVIVGSVKPERECLWFKVTHSDIE